MKKLDFTKEHMEKIFEMCRHYFPEQIVRESVYDQKTIIFTKIEENVTSYSSFSWVELCMTHLSEKILFNKDMNRPLHFCQDTYARMSNQLMNTFVGADKHIHPVDFLHSRFLKQVK